MGQGSIHPGRYGRRDNCGAACRRPTCRSLRRDLEPAHARAARDPGHRHKARGAPRQASLDQAIPRRLERLLPRRLHAADDQAVFRTRHGNIQQAVVLLDGLVARLCARAGGSRAVIDAARRPHRHGVPPVGTDLALCRNLDQRADLLAAGFGSDVGDEDDLGFQPFRAMHRHHAHFAGSHRQITLHVVRAGLDRCEETHERGAVLLFMRESAHEKCVNRIRSLRTQPGQQSRASSHDGQNCRKECEGPVAHGQLLDALQLAMRLPVLFIGRCRKR